LSGAVILEDGLVSFFNPELNAWVFKNWRCTSCPQDCRCMRVASFVETVLLTWNHESFIRESILSCLKQNLSSKSSVLVHDDASSDKTTYEAISLMRSAKIPMTLLSRVENQFKIANFSFVAYLFTASRAKYVALLDGDDYWTNRSKLRVMTSALEKFPRSNLAYHDFYVPLRKLPFISIRNPGPQGLEQGSLKSVLSDNPIGALTSVFRPSVLPVEMPKGFEKLPIGDLPIWALLVKDEPAVYVKKCMGVYRLHRQNYFGNLKPLKMELAHKQALDYVQNNIEVINPRPVFRSRTGGFLRKLLKLRFTPLIWLNVSAPGLGRLVRAIIQGDFRRHRA